MLRLLTARHHCQRDHQHRRSAQGVPAHGVTPGRKREARRGIPATR
ncbi:hypothetical protein DB31_3877 [Hyalangium minutum]|uniref:Uncharacterized protein n=1 Tax=Hyalangium minutum TaxID=394096 RepID=A0A085W500_9BACT|nr:hypothetical protein DB31_3877 [Hyalangium minutum]